MATTLTSPVEKVQLSGISWQTYEALLSELSSHRRLRLTYNQGNLEIMVPSPEHERYKKVLGRFVETLAEELEIPIEPLGSTTLKRLGISGAEPDECFYVHNLDLVKNQTRFVANQEPAPDLVVEIDITSSSEQRFAVYQDLGVSEVWVYNGQSFQIMQLKADGYVVVHESSIFSNLPLDEIDNFLQKVGDIDYLELVKTFRNWVKNQIESQ